MSMPIRGQRPEVTGQKKKSDGAAIMLALWAIFLLSALVISWALDIDSRLSLSGDATRMLKAEAVACSGAEVALHPAVNPDSTNLRGQLDNGASYEARLTGEGGRLNLNWLVAGEDPNRLGILRRYLENKGIDLNERNAMVDSLLDWVAPDTGLHHLNAPPESDDYRPSHTMLTRIDELKNVAGWSEFTSRPGLEDEFTLNSSGPIDLAWASRDVLLALPGLTPEVVDRFLQSRQGPDGIDGTNDDMQVKGMDEARNLLGLNQEQFKQLNALVSFKDPVLRVVSVGTAGKAKRTVQMVFRRVGLVPQLITWKEF
ncbi:MAG: ral secretion pathway protein [Verrucomicrobiota bacterium]